MYTSSKNKPKVALKVRPLMEKENVVQVPGGAYWSCAAYTFSVSVTALKAYYNPQGRPRMYVA